MPNEKIDWCRYFAEIERDPKAIVPQLTVRQFFEAKEHVSGCDTCNNRVERVLANTPSERFPQDRMN